MPATSRRRTARVLTTHALSALAMSLPWPLLLVMVAHASHSAAVLGFAAAGRLAPYVVLSWWVGRLADRHSRDRIVRMTLVGRVVLLASVGGAIATEHASLAVLLASLTVAAGTPAYPALAAGMPGLAGDDRDRATELLVTVEVAAFVVGPALGGMLLLVPEAVGPVAVILTLVALGCYAGVRQPRPMPSATPVRISAGLAAGSAAGSTAEGAGARPDDRLAHGSGPLRTALVAMMLVNAVGSGAGVVLLPLAQERWSGTGGGATYGLATALLGFGALGAPLLGAPLRGGRLRGGRGRRTRPPLGPGLVLVGVALAAVAASPGAGWAAVPLLLIGAAAVQVEAAATETIQREAGDDRSAGVLGLADTLMVSAGLVGAVAAPVGAQALGAVRVLAILGAVCLVPVVVGALRRRVGGETAYAYPTTVPRSTTAAGRASTVRSANGSAS
ncbi:hypothetical protein JCM18899A_19340 [Nocardioides sp. AN3]